MKKRIQSSIYIMLVSFFCIIPIFAASLEWEQEPAPDDNKVLVHAAITQAEKDQGGGFFCYGLILGNPISCGSQPPFFLNSAYTICTDMTGNIPLTHTFEIVFNGSCYPTNAQLSFGTRESDPQLQTDCLPQAGPITIYPGCFGTPTYTPTATPTAGEIDVYVKQDYPSANSAGADADVTLSIAALTPTPIMTAKADANGFINFKPLTPGPYIVRAEKNCFYPTAVAVNVPYGKAVANLFLESQPIKISGQVFSGESGFAPLAGAQVVFNGYSAQTNSTGYYEMFVKPGTPGALIASMPGSRPTLIPRRALITADQVEPCDSVGQNFTLRVVNTEEFGVCPVGDPVDPASGELNGVIQDFKLMGKQGLDFEFTRYYRSDLAGYDGPFGPGWTHNFNANLMIFGYGNADEKVRLMDTDGKYYTFARQPDGSYLGPEYLNYSLIKSGGLYIVDKRDEKLKYEFEIFLIEPETAKARLKRVVLRAVSMSVNYQSGNTAVISSITDAAGRSTLFSYLEGRIDTISNGGEILADYGYSTYYPAVDPRTRLFSVTGHLLECSYSYTYKNGMLCLTYKKENKAPDGYYEVTYGYDDYGRVLTITSPGSSYGTTNVTTFVYKKGSPGNFAAFPGMDEINDPVVSTTVPADQQAYNTSIDRSGFGEEQYYGGRGQLLQKISSAGTKNVGLNTANLRPSSITDEYGRTVSYLYETESNNLTWAGRQMQLSDGAASVSVETKYIYNTNDELIETEDGEGRKTTYSRDTQGNITVITRSGGPSTETVIKTYNPYLGADSYTETTHINNDQTLTKSFVWNFADKNLLVLTETTGSQTFTTKYDKFGRVKEKTTFAGTETYLYNDASGSSIVTVNRPGSNDSVYTYGSRGKIASSTDGNSKITFYQYNSDDSLSYVTFGSSTKSYFYYETGPRNGLLQSMSDGEKETVYDYNDDGKIKSVIFDGEKTEYFYTYSGGLETREVKDNAQKSTVSTINQLGQVIKVTGADNQSVKYTYDKSGNMTFLTDQRNIQTKYEYDNLNRLKKETQGFGTAPASAIEYFYDDENNMIEKNDQNLSRTLKYEYDAFNRMLFIKDSGGNILKEMAYDNTCSCGGKITSETVPGYGSIGYTYTPEGWLDVTTYPGPVTIDNDYDAAGNVTDVKLNGSVITHYAYDANYRITTLTDKVITGKDRLYSFTYHGTTALKELINYPNKTKMDYEYGTAYRLTKANGLMPVTGDVLTKHEIPVAGGRDAVGNILLKNISTGPVNYKYDSIYQLTAYLNPAAELKEVQYAYDEAGNRKYTLPVNPPANADWNQINEVNQITAHQIYPTFYSITYDPNGNMLSNAARGASFTWDYNNRLEGATTGTKSITYKYNYNDLRVYKESIPGGSTRFYYNGSQLVAEGDGSKITKVYTNDNEGVLGMTRFVYDTAGTLKNKQQLYYLFDDLGSVVMITNHQGLPTQYYQYDAWGNITNASNDPINGLSFVGRYGGFKDWDTGLTYFWHRWYDGELGRWISRDPIGININSSNLYLYAHNNSVLYYDPNGLKPEDINKNTVVCDGKGGFRIQIGSAKGKITEPCTIAHEISHKDDLEKRYGIHGCPGKDGDEHPTYEVGDKLYMVWRRDSECKADKVGLSTCRKNIKCFNDYNDKYEFQLYINRCKERIKINCDEGE